MPHYRRIHGFHKDCGVGKPAGNHRENTLYVPLGKVHGQSLDDDQHRHILLADFAAPIFHGGHGNLRNRAAFRQKLFPHRHRFRQVEVIPMCVTRHPVAAGIQPAGDVDHHRAGVRRKPFLRHPVEHDGSGNDAAAHGRILVRKGKIVVQLLDDSLRFCVVDRTSAAALFRPCINGLQHGLRHAGEFDFFFHVILPPLAKPEIFPHTGRTPPDAPSPTPHGPSWEYRGCESAENSA